MSFEPFGGSKNTLIPDPLDMEMDIDMEVDIAPEDLAAAAAYREDAMATDARTSGFDPTVANSSYSELAHEKLHLRGVDLLSTDDIKAFVAEHIGQDTVARVEWIDDTSANLRFGSGAVAREALGLLADPELSAIDAPDGPALRPAKRFTGKPEISLQIRAAVMSDAKQPGARERSRYYLFNPEQDPGERRRRQGRRRHSGYNGEGDNQYRRRDFDDREHRRRRRDNDAQGFGADLYDDNDAAVASRERRARLRPDSKSSFSSEEVKREEDRMVRRRKSDQNELFPDKGGSNAVARLRRRSASPVRNRDADTEMTDGAARSRFRERSYSPPPPYAEKDPRKELFPERRPKRNPATELRGDITPQYNRNKELFAAKLSSSVHRRSDAFDAADETADLFANRMAVPFVDGSSDHTKSSRLSSRATKPDNSRSLADRMTFPKGDTVPCNSRGPSDPIGFSIRGAASHSDVQGILVRGQAAESSGSNELFPGKSNKGKELFSQKLEGRGGRRNQAEDMFN
ncbi:MAG: hypothetical protein M1814_003491 [Vezdaea aestivalis]|nr:MAG: hypothetical protein M1814_003491 [Vezdaea aestivalis]